MAIPEAKLGHVPTPWSEEDKDSVPGSFPKISPKENGEELAGLGWDTGICSSHARILLYTGFLRRRGRSNWLSVSNSGDKSHAYFHSYP